MKITNTSLVLICMFVFSGCTQTGSETGGDRDQHGCLTSAGYTWCEPKQKCIRLRQEDCDDGSDVDGKKICNVDSDCIPLPSECHPHTCINTKSAFMFKPPEVCTEIFDCGAAYDPEDCLCQDGQCVNGNEGKNCR